MSVDAILQQIDNLSPDEQADLFRKLRERYGTPEPAPSAGPRPDQTGIYKVEEVIDRARRSR